MPEETTATQANATESAESITSGEAKASTEGGESEKTASVEKGTSGEGLFDGMTAEQLHKSYKSIQSEYTKLNDGYKKLERFGGPDKMLQWAEYLSNDPEFATWVKDRQQKNILGVKDDEMDADTKRAYDTVMKIADHVADNKVREILKKEIAPLSEGYKQQLLDKHFETMDSKYGKDWQEVRDIMSELSDELPEKVQDRPTFDDIEDLYFKALRKTGKFDSYAAKQYEKKLNDKKSKATERPAAIVPSAPKKARTIQEAFTEAKKIHSM